MNNSKKLAKNGGIGSEKQSKGSGSVIIASKNKILLTLGIAAIIILCAGVFYMQLRPRAVLKVTQTNEDGGEKTNTVYMKEAVYDIYTLETQFNSYASLYQQMYGTTYWEMENADEDGRNGASAAKKQVMDGLKQKEILYMEAQKLGHTLTDEEKKAADESATKAMESMTDGQKKLPGLDEETLKEVFAKNALVQKYRQVIISESGIDREALKATVKKEDFRQYTMQYYKVSNKTGSGEEEVDVTAEQKQTNLNNMKALQEKAKTAEDFTKLLEENDTTGIQAVQTQELLEKDMDSSSFLTKKLRKRLIKMSNDQISDVIEGEDGYYLVKMVNNDDSAAYDKECDSVVSAEETKQFNAKYAEIKTRYNTEVQSYWKGRVKLGSYTAVQ